VPDHFEYVLDFRRVIFGNFSLDFGSEFPANRDVRANMFMFVDETQFASGTLWGGLNGDVL
jgi:hypothetical protein